jgi:hypothetical protein
MMKLLFSVLTLGFIVEAMTTASYFHIEEEYKLSGDSSKIEARRGLRASQAPTHNKKTPSPTKRATTRRPKATHTPSLSPTSSPTTPNILECLTVDKKVYDCGDPITVSFNLSGREDPEPARIRDFIGIFPYYVNSFDVPEVWQWTCSPPPVIPKACSNGPKSSGNSVFNSLPEYNLEPSAWPVSANYNPLKREVNRFFKVVLLRGDGTTYCISSRFEILENSLPGCNIRLSSPSG